MVFPFAAASASRTSVRRKLDFASYPVDEFYQGKVSHPFPLPLPSIHLSLFSLVFFLSFFLFFIYIPFTNLFLQISKMRSWSNKGLSQLRRNLLPPFTIQPSRMMTRRSPARSHLQRVPRNSPFSLIPSSLHQVDIRIVYAMFEACATFYPPPPPPPSHLQARVNEGRLKPPAPSKYIEGISKYIYT